METIQLFAFLFIFLIMAVAMFLRKIPALIALPLMAFLIPPVSGVSVADTMQFVIGEGALKLHNAYTVALFGSMLSILLQKTGVAENMIKQGAELAGDNPWTISVLMLILITLLFTTLGGLGAIIMVATIVLPILSSVGLSAMSVVGIFLIGLSMGGIMNAGNWAVYVDVMGLGIDEIRPFALVMFGITFIMGLCYITIQLYRDGHDLPFKKIIRNSLFTIGILVLLFLLYGQLNADWRQWIEGGVKRGLYGLKLLLGLFMAFSFLLSLKFAVSQRSNTLHKIHWTAYLSPLIPLLLILIFSMNFIAAFICGLIYAYFSTYRKGHLNTFIGAVLEGGGVVMPAVVLMFGIGMLLNAIMGPAQSWEGGWPVLTLLRPVMSQLVPQNGLIYVVLFGIAAPLALYRGPLNVWGMGYGLAAVFLASGMHPGAIMGLLMAVGQVQGISDPTNTHNVWLANEMQVDVQKVLWNTIPFTWVVAFIGLTASALIFFK
ncbi:MAG: citrate transporter [Calditrichaeota bacterium]|nr:citrate transporter [Calditrichota bacterium]